MSEMNTQRVRRILASSQYNAYAEGRNGVADLVAELTKAVGLLAKADTSCYWWHRARDEFVERY